MDISDDESAGRVVAVVPTKLTSQRLPRKNLLDLGGHPLFWYSIRAAQLCPEIGAVYVSSEAVEVLELAQTFSAETIERPAALSNPKVTNFEVLRHAQGEITQRQGAEPELMVLLQPTHPFRQPVLITEGITQMRRDPTADSLITVVRADDLRGEIQGDRFLPEFRLPRDKASEPVHYRNTGSFYIFRVATTLAVGRMYTDRIRPLVLQRPEFEVDIDEGHDLALARCLLEANREEFTNFFDNGKKG